MAKVNSYKDLIVWQKSMDLVVEVYACSKLFPKEEIYGLTSKIRRSAVSISSKIAEGFGRKSSGDYIRILRIALGSIFECITQLEIALRVGFLTQKKFSELEPTSIEVSKMLNSLKASIEKNRPNY